MVGQELLLEQFNNYTLDTIPHSMLFTGDWGCGKHTLCEYVSERFNLELNQLDSKITYEVLEEIGNKVEPNLYVIDGELITLKEESALLKFLEEPLKNTYIIILSESKNFMLNTIVNRCVEYHFERYTTDQLKEFNPNGTEELFKLASTPGKVLKWGKYDIRGALELGNKILEKVGVSNFPNVLTLSDKLIYNDEDTTNKYDCQFFFDTLRYCAREKVVANPDKMWSEVYKITNTLYNNSRIPHVDKRRIFEHYLYELRMVERTKLGKGA